MFTQSDRDYLVRIATLLLGGQQAFQDVTTGKFTPAPADWPQWIVSTLGDIKGEIPTSGTALTTQQAQQLSDLTAAVARIEAGLKGA